MMRSGLVFAVLICFLPQILAGESVHIFTSASAKESDPACILCHTSHNSSIKQPVWNPSRSRPLVVYSSSTMDAAQPSVSEILGGPSGQCLSCHDGTVGSDYQLINHRGAISLGNSLDNDHPVSIVYEQARTAQTPSEFNGYAAAELAVTDGRFTLPLFGSTQSSARVECTSCHKMHDNTNDHYVRISNNRSALCYVCHIK